MDVIRFTSVMWFFIFLPVFSTEHIFGCPSYQHLERGRTGIIQCNFEAGYYGVSWYYLEEFSKGHSFLHIINGVKKGEGYLSGEFDVLPNGSLIIRNVTLQHDRNFKVSKFNSAEEHPVSFDIRIVVTVKPSIAFPVINFCGEKVHTCFMQLDEYSELVCSVELARPVIDLRWAVRGVHGDEETVFQGSVTTFGDVFTSRVTTINIFPQSQLLGLLVCVADNHHGVLKEEEATIFIEKKDINLAALEAVPSFVERNSRLELNCMNTLAKFIVWKKTDHRGNPFQLLSYAALFTEDVFKTYSHDFELHENGSLILPRTETRHEALYGCISQSERSSKVALFNVVVIVHAYPVISGCTQHQYCFLEVPAEGSLTCAVKGVRPRVKLEWKTLAVGDSALITFANHELTVYDVGDVYDVILTSTYRIQDTATERLTLECRMTSKNISILTSTAKFDLFINNEISSGETVAEKRSLLWILMIILPLLATSVYLCRRCFPWGREKRRQNGNQMNEEMLSLLCTEEESQSGLKRILVKELKRKYKDEYEGVQPIPYIKDRLVDVNRVFVEGGFEKYVSVQEGGGAGKWEKLKSYHNVYNSNTPSYRTIIESDPGYGKSTLTLQFAYDWCNENSNSSAMSDVGILILLKLRQLGGVQSIYAAIKQFLLPRDSCLGEKDIETVIRESSSTVFILDGYDEYPDAETEPQRDIISIIKGEMLQDTLVIVTTRSFILPEFYPPNTDRIRLTGFDEEAKKAYILKAVVDNKFKLADDIIQRLEVHAVLRGLCQVPLFFVMFAHMTHENEDFKDFTSVTSFFRFMIASFHNHLKNKLKDMKNFGMENFAEKDHTILDKVAFESLWDKRTKSIWDKNELCQRLGEESYSYYKRVGVLVEEDVLDLKGSREGDDIGYKKKVRFFHNLFREWYAAHRLSKIFVQADSNIDHIFDQVNPINYHYVYRFACGLDQRAGERIISHLKRRTHTSTFAILCLLELSEKGDQIQKSIRELCLDYITIDDNDSALLQWSIVQLMEIGATNKMTISFVWLRDCFQSIDPSSGNITLKSKVVITPLSSLEELAIGEKGRQMGESEVCDILKFSSQCSGLKVLRFCYVSMPESISADTTSALQSRGVKVLWMTDDNEYFLDLGSGKWKNCTSSSPTEVYNGNVSAKKNLLIFMLREKYQVMTKTIQPIPEKGEKLHPVNKVFVEGDIECLVLKDDVRSREAWQTIGSYKQIFKDLRARSKRRLLEGKTGYGKSTVALQMAYDWCFNTTTSPLSNFEVFLLLQLQPEDMFAPIMTGLKRSVLPKDCPLRWIDIESMLQSCPALMVLDGYNIDVDRQRQETSDVCKIMNRKLLKDVDVIITCTAVPIDCLRNTKRLRMTGFNDMTRDNYVKNAMPANYSEVMSMILQQFEETPVLKSFSQAPFFFVMLAHLCEETKSFEKFKETKDFFKFFSNCFYSQTGKYSNKNGIQMHQNNEDELTLDEIAFNKLCKSERNVVWDKEELENEIGRECYDRFVRTGILTEETFVYEESSSNGSQAYKTEVQFAHKLLRDWHAANYISNFPTEFEGEKLKNVVTVIDVSVLHHLCTSVLELQCDVAPFIEYAKGRSDFNEFATSFVVKNDIDISSIWKCAVELCSKQMLFTNKQTEIFQRSMVHLLAVASEHKIPIKSVYLLECNSIVDTVTEDVILQSHISLPVLTSLEELIIRDTGRTFTKEEVNCIMRYSSKCLGLKTLWFYNCLLPQLIPHEYISALKARAVRVVWTRYSLNLQSGLWEDIHRKAVMTDQQYQLEVNIFNTTRKPEDKSGLFDNNVVEISGDNS